MLIEFQVENYRSICDRQTLNALHDPTIKDGDEPVIYSAVEGIPNLLRTVAIYGANASGKSTLLRALFDMRRFILYSEKKLTYGDKIEMIVPFLLDNESKEKPTSFEIKFVIGSSKYTYGFSATKHKITKEYLIAYPNNKKQIWFERTLVATDSSDYDWRFSPYFKGEKETIRKATLENVLFFSKAIKENNDMLKPIYLFFKNSLDVMPVDGANAECTEELLKDEGGKKKVLEFLQAADLGIDDLIIESRKISEGDLDLPDNMPQAIKDQIKADILGKEHTITRTVHYNNDTNTPVLFTLDQESVGTNKLFNRAGLFIKALEEGKILLIDELESSLHCRLVGFIIRLFNSPQTNPNNAQLIFSTHSSVALTNNYLRRDQIWFASKTNNKTSLYPLKRAKFDKKVVRKGENLIRAYLSGEYSAVPNVKEQYNLF
jgi:AAA15 family ATPase/GTPase